MPGLSRIVGIQSGFWPAFVLLLLTGTVLRLTGYDFSLPYIDHPDEPNFILAAQMIIDHGSAMPMGMQGYPPGVITLSYLPLRYFPQPEQHPLWVTPYLRIVTILAGAFTALPIALIARRFGGHLSGVIAAALWLFSSELVTYSRYFTPDPFVTLLALTSLWLAIEGALKRRTDLLNLSLVVWAIAVIFKYQALFMLPVLMALSALLLRERADRQRMAANLLWQGAALAAFGFWLTVLYPAFQATEIPHFVASADRFQVPTPLHVAQSIIAAGAIVGSVPLWIAGFAGVGVAIFTRFSPGRAKTIHPVPREAMLILLTLAATAVLWAAGVSFFGDQDVFQNLAVTAVLTILLCCGIGWFLNRARDMATRLHPGRWGSWIAAGAMAIMFVPVVQQSVETTQHHLLPDRRNDLTAYMDSSLEAGPHIATADNHKTFNRDWGGYSGLNDFPLVTVSGLTERSLAEWRADGVRYAIMSVFEFENLPDDVVSEITLLKVYPPSAAYRGPDMAVVCLCVPESTGKGTLGDVELVGYTLEQDDDRLHVRYFWRAGASPDGNYAVFNHLVDGEGNLIAQADGSPLVDDRRRTQDWTDSTETLISREFALDLQSLPAGSYSLHMGFYDRITGGRLLTRDGMDYLQIESIEVP